MERFPPPNLRTNALVEQNLIVLKHAVLWLIARAVACEPGGDGDVPVALVTVDPRVFTDAGPEVLPRSSSLSTTWGT